MDKFQKDLIEWTHRRLRHAQYRQDTAVTEVEKRAAREDVEYHEMVLAALKG